MPVLWPVYTQTIPFRMLLLFVTIHDDIHIYFHLFVSKRCRLKAEKVLETATRSKKHETIMEGHEHVHVRIHVHFHVPSHIHIHVLVCLRVFVFVVWCRVTSCVARRCSLFVVCRS